MSERRFQKLRRALKESDIDESYLARRLLLSESTVSFRMTAKYPWKIDECYQIMDMLKLPHSELSEYFPKDGIAAS